MLSSSASGSVAIFVSSPACISQAFGLLCNLLHSSQHLVPVTVAPPTSLSSRHHASFCLCHFSACSALHRRRQPLLSAPASFVFLPQAFVVAAVADCFQQQLVFFVQLCPSSPPAPAAALQFTVITSNSSTQLAAVLCLRRCQQLLSSSCFVTVVPSSRHVQLLGVSIHSAVFSFCSVIAGCLLLIGTASVVCVAAVGS